MEITMHNKLWIVFFILSLLVLIPGLTLPMLTLTATVDKAEMIKLAVNSLFAPDGVNSITAQFARGMLQQIPIEGSVEIFNKTRSVLETMQDLISAGNVFVGLLIGLFAVVVPACKLCLIIFTALIRDSDRKIQLQKFSDLISKWSMSDVFVMGIIVSTMAANATKSSGDAVQMSASLGLGFYFFTAYCICSIVSSQLWDKQRVIG